ncbi:peroxidase family protein [Craurococcus roseus]|uniref:Peroxidase family protein n=2 Tax=Craurococcus roseus TaxID=77585 RepID=A0ABN1G5F7_9PROT
MQALHGGSPLGATDTATAPPPPAAVGPSTGGGPDRGAAREGRLRNFLGEPAERFAAIEKTPQRLKALAHMMTRTAGTRERDSKIPAGFTYLLQFVVHDLVDTEPSVLEAPHVEPGDRGNRRRKPLRLETLYGDGAGRAAERDESDADKLLVGPMAPGGAGKGGAAPRRDAPRCPLAQAGEEPPFWRTLLADEKNDTNVVLSQLTVLFTMLHNELVEAQGKGAEGRFDKARQATTLIYRHILRQEVLPKIIHPAVWKLYDGGFERLEPGPTSALPVEFTHGAFRFGHAMAQHRYQLNQATEDYPTRITDLLRQTAERAGREDLPLTADWIVAWSRFFGFEGRTEPNYARRIGPTVIGSLTAETLFPPKGAAGMPGLVHRDLMSSALAGLWSVRALIRRLREDERLEQLRDLLPGSDAELRAQVRGWLEKNRHPEFQLEDADVAALTDDPPMSFYVLLEAELARQKEGYADVETLGPLGSVVVAEVMLGILDHEDPEFGRAGGPLADKLTGVSKAFHGLGNFDTMAGLIHFVDERRPHPSSKVPAPRSADPEPDLV